MSNVRKIGSRKALFLLVTVAFVYGLNYLIMPAFIGERLELYFRPHFSVKFDSDTWKRAGPHSWKPGGPRYGVRCEMVDDLLASRNVDEIGEESLIRMLGAPDLADNKGGDRRMFYVLGDQRTYPARSIWFPGLFGNLDRWMLEIRLRDGMVYFVRIFFD